MESGNYRIPLDDIGSIVDVGIIPSGDKLYITFRFFDEPDFEGATSTVHLNATQADELVNALTKLKGGINAASS